MYLKKIFITLFGLLLFMQSVIAQSKDDVAIKEIINTFFEGMHSVDTIKIKETTNNNVILQTAGNGGIQTENFNDFLKNIGAINPETTKIKEKILSFDIKMDGIMANAWMTYEFYVNNKLSHCGVNSFQLFKYKEGWKIFYIVDTRRKENCNK